MQDTDRYALTLLTMPHTDWADDGWRVHPEYDRRLAFFNEVRAQLEDLHRPYTVIEGTWEEREEKAKQAVADLLR
jgi:nicotinamide riboside kinase